MNARHRGMAISPGAPIFVLLLAFKLLGDGLRDALDPRQRPRQAGNVHLQAGNPLPGKLPAAAGALTRRGKARIVAPGGGWLP